MQILNFKYDSSIGTPDYSANNDNYIQYNSQYGTVHMATETLLSDFGPFWPQTLDYRPPWNCYNKTDYYGGQSQCPKQSYPGIWQFPVSIFPRNLMNLNETEVNQRKHLEKLTSNLPIYVSCILTFATYYFLKKF